MQATCWLVFRDERNDPEISQLSKLQTEFSMLRLSLQGWACLCFCMVRFDELKGVPTLWGWLTVTGVQIHA